MKSSFKTVPTDLYRHIEPEAGQVYPKSRHRRREGFDPDWAYICPGSASKAAVVAPPALRDVRRAGSRVAAGSPTVLPKAARDTRKSGSRRRAMAVWKGICGSRIGGIRCCHHRAGRIRSLYIHRCARAQRLPRRLPWLDAAV